MFHVKARPEQALFLSFFPNLARKESSSPPDGVPALLDVRRQFGRRALETKSMARLTRNRSYATFKPTINFASEMPQIRSITPDIFVTE